MKKALISIIGIILILAGIVWYSLVNSGRAYEPEKSTVSSQTTAGTSATVNIKTPAVIEQTESKITDTQPTQKLDIGIPTHGGAVAGYTPPSPMEPEDKPPDGAC